MCDDKGGLKWSTDHRPGVGEDVREGAPEMKVREVGWAREAGRRKPGGGKVLGVLGSSRARGNTGRFGLVTCFTRQDRSKRP